jgi:uncharacterized protein
MEHSDFVVLLNKIPPEGLEREFEIANPAAAGIELSVPLAAPIRAHFEVERLGNEIRVHGTVGTSVRLECSRCLAPFAHEVDADVDAMFAPQSKDEDEEHQHELAPDELEVQPLVEGGADLRGVIAEHIHLALPLKPLCRESCVGLCPRCGREAAAGHCGCEPAGVDPRWEALKKLTVP